MNRFPLSDLVFYLHSRNVPRAEIDRIALILLEHTDSTAEDRLVSKLGAKRVGVVRDFMRLAKQTMDCHKRIRDLVDSTRTRVEGDDVATKRARLESVMIAVHTLGAMSGSRR